MTEPKRPLPSLRFVMHITRGQSVALIPQTTPKGYVVPDIWALPGGKVETTDMLIKRCKKNRWRWEIVGESNRRSQVKR